MKPYDFKNMLVFLHFLAYINKHYNFFLPVSPSKCHSQLFKNWAQKVNCMGCHLSFVDMSANFSCLLQSINK